MAKEKKSEDIKEVGGRILPNNFDAEQAVLGSALIDGDAALMVVSKLDEIDFYNATHRNIYKAIKKLYANQVSIDFLTVSDELEKQNLIASVGGMAYIQTLSNIVPSAASCAHYIDIVKRDSVLRQVISACSNVINKSFDKGTEENIIGVAEKAIYEIAEKGQSGELVKIETPLDAVVGKFEDIGKDPSSLRGLKTGFYQIDKVINGLQKSDLIIIAARPGVGKTSLAMNIVSNAALESKAKCAVFSLEMGKEQLTQRMLCSVANVSMAKALRGELDENDWERIIKAKNKLQNADIYIDDNAMNTPSQVMSKCRKLKREKGLDLIVIDYIGLMKADEKFDGGNRQNEVASISRQLKIMAKELNVPLIALSQLNRSVEQRPDGKPGKPKLSDLRESGSIEQDADMVWFIHRDMSQKEIDENKSGDYTAEVIIAKFRNGQTGSVYLDWDGKRTSFVNREKDANEQSLVEQYQINQDAKNKNKQRKTLEDFKSSIDGVINEMSTLELNNLDIGEPEADDDLTGLEPPPEVSGMLAGKDFSNANIGDGLEDELF